MGVDITNKGYGRKIPTRRFKKTAQRILKLLGHNEAELSLALVGDEEIRELNARYRKRSEPTDVLSFPSGAIFPPGNQTLGDVIISVEQAQRQARKRKKTLQEEMEWLLIHGILHLLGYNHERSGKEARVMRALERKIHRSLCETRELRV